MIALSDRLSRWTLLIFACALVNFVTAQTLVVAGLTWPAAALTSGTTLVAVHLLTIGWLTLLMLGALFQFVPVITAQPLLDQRLSAGALLLIETGLIGMVAGFIALGESPQRHLWCLGLGTTIVVTGIGLALLNLGAPLLRSGPLPLPGRFIRAGFLFLTVTMLFGAVFVFALTLPGAAPAVLVRLTASVGSHVLSGIGGWLTLTAMGVSYKLLPMFMLAPEERGVLGEAVLKLGVAGLFLAIGSGVLRLWWREPVFALAQNIGWILIGMSLIGYLADLVRLYRARRRPRLELHNRAVIGAFASLVCVVVTGASLLATGTLPRGAPALAWLALFGWLSGLGLSQLYKIVPFLTWLTRFGHTIGRKPIPRVQDLVRESHAMPWFWIYFAGVPIAATGVALRASLPVRIGAALSLIATLGLCLEYWRAWRAAYLQPTQHILATMSANSSGGASS